MSNLTYTSQLEKDADKALLEQCREALDISPSAMRLDECECWRLHGSRGSITTWGDGCGYLLSLYERPKQAWTWAKKRLGAATLDKSWAMVPTAEFPPMAVTQNGEREGVLRFTLPVAAEITLEIRELAGLHKRVELTEDDRLARAERLRKLSVTLKTGDAGDPGISHPETPEP